MKGLIMSEGITYKPDEVKKEVDLSFIINKDGRVYHNPEFFSPKFNELFAKYENIALSEVRLRSVNNGNTKEWREVDYARTEAHDATAKQLVEDLERQGKLIGFWDARRIVNKLLEEKFPGTDERDMIAKAFLRDRD